MKAFESRHEAAERTMDLLRSTPVGSFAGVVHGGEASSAWPAGPHGPRVANPSGGRRQSR